MEPWKIGAIALLLAGVVGYGVISNSGGTNDEPSNPEESGPLVKPAPTPSSFSGKTLSAWPQITQWANSPKAVTLSQYRGKPVLLEVFRIECPHCQDAAPFIQALQKRYRTKGVQFVGVQAPALEPKTHKPDPNSPEAQWDAVRNWIVEKGYSWPVGFDAQNTWFSKLGKDVSYPSFFLLDRSGKVVFFETGHTVRSAIELGIQMEKAAPGKGDVQTRAKDLNHFLSLMLGLKGDDLSPGIAKRLG